MGLCFVGVFIGCNNGFIGPYYIWIWRGVMIFASELAGGAWQVIHCSRFSVGLCIVVPIILTIGCFSDVL